MTTIASKRPRCCGCQVRWQTTMMTEYKSLLFDTISSLIFKAIIAKSRYKYGFSCQNCYKKFTWFFYTSKRYLLKKHALFSPIKEGIKNGIIIVIQSVHPSERVTIAAFWREPAGWKAECLFDECWMNITLIWDLFPFSSVITLRIPISSVALHGDTSAARFELKFKNNFF